MSDLFSLALILLLMAALVIGIIVGWYIILTHPFFIIVAVVLFPFSSFGKALLRRK